MKISRNWLQTFFEQELLDAQTLADALTFHAFEIESVEGDILDVKITPNRGHDCLSHRGIAKELSAILNIPLKNDPFRSKVALPPTDAISITIDTPLCSRYIGGVIRGVKVEPTSDPVILQFLEAIGQRSINNVVDATNYVMFSIGQPLHAFDAGKLSDTSKIGVRAARQGEKMLALDDKEYALGPNDLVIVDGGDSVIGIAGVKGGKPTGIDEKTTDIIVESANFDGVSVRKTAQALKLRTDASERFQQVISPELAAYGMRAAADLIVKLAGGEIVGFTDAYPSPQTPHTVQVSAVRINAVLGTTLAENDIANVFKRLDLPFEKSGDAFVVTPPFERLDLLIPEDVVEEVGRIIGYDKVPAVELPPFPKQPEVNANFYAAEQAREELVAKGYSEVYTSVFAEKGERQVLNKVGGERPFLRSDLKNGLQEALERNARNKDLLGLKEVKLFEIGTVWGEDKEELVIGTIAEDEKVTQKILTSTSIPSQYENLPLSTTARYQSFSKYPFIVRDIAMWVPSGTVADNVLEVIREQAGELLVRSEKFDEFKKSEKTSYAFRLVFQSFEKTLTDAEVNGIMEKIDTTVKAKGWEVR